MRPILVTDRSFLPFCISRFAWQPLQHLSIFFVDSATLSGFARKTWPFCRVDASRFFPSEASQLPKAKAFLRGANAGRDSCSVDGMLVWPISDWQYPVKTSSLVSGIKSRLAAAWIDLAVLAQEGLRENLDERFHLLCVARRIQALSHRMAVLYHLSHSIVRSPDGKN